VRTTHLFLLQLPPQAGCLRLRLLRRSCQPVTLCPQLSGSCLCYITVGGQVRLLWEMWAGRGQGLVPRKRAVGRHHKQDRHALDKAPMHRLSQISNSSRQPALPHPQALPTFWSNSALTRPTSSPTQAIMPSFSAAAASAAVARADASPARRSASASRRSS